MNKVVLVGRLTKDPEVRYSQSAEPVAIARYTLAVNRTYKRENEPDADFINIVTLGKNAEFVGKYFKKGQMVSVAGRIQVRQWEDPAKGRQYFTEIVTEDVEFAESRSSYESRANSSPSLPPDSFYTASSVGPSRPAAPKTDFGSSNDDFSHISDGIDEQDLPF